MRLTVIILLGFTLQLSAKAVSQSITYSAREVPLTKVFSIIKKQTGYVVFYDQDWIEFAKPITISATNEPLENFLHKILKDLPLDFTIEEKNIVINKKAPLATDGEAATLVLPPSLIRGRVLDAEGSPLPGVTVTSKSGKVLGVTNAEGIFSVNVSAGDVLVISSIGFESTEYKITSAIVASSDQQSTSVTGISITLKRKESQLDEVVVNKGYYTEKQKLSTGNVSKVTAEEIGKQPVTNILQAIQGRMAGVQITQSTGVPGGAFNVQIRGVNSLRREGNYPLYIIDGMPFSSTSLSSSTAGGSIVPNANPLNSINFSDVESFEVLKDADATSIYGSRGANGVVLITTKKAKAGKTTVDINIYQGAGTVAHKLDLLNSKQYLEMRHEALANDGVTPSLSYPGYSPDLLLWDTTRYTDWQKKLIGGTANTTNVQATVSAGNANTQFLFGGGYYRETTVFPGDFAFTRGSGRFNLNHISDNQKFKAAITANYTAVNNNLLRDDLTRFAIYLSPVAPAIYDDNGNLNWQSNTWANPFALLRKTYKGNTDNLITNANLSYEVIHGLELRTTLSYNLLQVKEISTLPISAINPAYAATGTSVFANNNIKGWIIEPQLEYKRKFAKGLATILVGSTFNNNTQESQSSIAQGYTSDVLLENIKAAASVFIANSDFVKYRYNALFGRINYNWDEKYLVNLTARRDGSSRFGPGKQFANFGAVGAAWIFSNEGFIKNNLPVLSFGKLRSSYGTTGSDQIGDYQFLDTYSSTSYTYQGGGGLIPTRLANADFAWESNKKLEIALELGFLNDRILFNTSWYRNRSSNQLVGDPLPVITGESSIQNNFPATVQNKGWEFELNTINLKAKNITWTSALNLTIFRNKLLKYPGLEASSYAYTYAIGQPLSVKRGFPFSKIDPQTGEYVFKDIDGNGTGGEFPGDYVVLKNIGQNFYGGLQNSLSFKHFQVDIFFQFVKQTGVGYLSNFQQPGIFGQNEPTIVMGRWQKPGDVTSISRFTQNYSSSYQTANSSSDINIVDASFIRLKNVSLSYNLPEKIKEKLRLRNAKIYMQGQNLFTITNYLGFDPENQNSAALPALRVLTVGVQLTL